MEHKIDTAKIAEAAKAFAQDGATLKQLRGVTNEELEAVYFLAYGYYQTGRIEEASKLFRFLVFFDHLNAKYWFGLGAVHQVAKNYQDAIVCYGYSSFLDLSNPKPQYHAAECCLAMGDKLNAASALEALNEYSEANTEVGREYRAKAAELRKKIGEEAFTALAEDEKKQA
jgi:type III secretion system low calcium response chaperone LcrH/SycD